jgi:hypothetical protein
MSERHACPCCGYLTLKGVPPGTYELCPVCFWEDDAVQYEDPTYSGGANAESLEEARENFRRFRASAQSATALVRPPRPDEEP